MGRQKTFCIILFLLRFCDKPNFCISTNEVEKIKDGKVEKIYPNGTIIGKYSYKDKAGNPINVKYFADKHGFGVELNSVKLEGHQVPAEFQTEDKLMNSSFDLNTMFPTYRKVSNMFKYVFHGKHSNDADTEADTVNGEIEDYPTNNNLRNRQKFGYKKGNSDTVE